jgi:hypothetical protein
VAQDRRQDLVHDRCWVQVSVRQDQILQEVNASQIAMACRPQLRDGPDAENDVGYVDGFVVDALGMKPILRVTRNREAMTADPVEGAEVLIWQTEFSERN